MYGVVTRIAISPFPTFTGTNNQIGGLGIAFTRPAMKLKPQELEANGYQLLDTLNHREIVPFVRMYIKKRTRFSILYTLSNILAGALVILFIVINMVFEKTAPGTIVTHLSYGIALAFALTPLHEFIHVLAYKSQGAEKTSYDANLKKFYFMAMADHFVANRKEFQIVALAPFISISAGFLLSLLFTGPLWSLTVAGILLTHTAFCSGDFALLSYFDFHKELDVLTYDDKANRISFFYGKKLQGA